jgi:hypothetical protein
VAHGDTQAEALQRIEEVKRLWIQAGLEHGQPIPTPRDGDSLPSGKWLQRVPRSLHKNLVRLAKIEGTSLNQLVTSILSEYVGITKRAGTVSWMSAPGPISGMGMITMHGVSAHIEGGYTVTRQAYNEVLR